MSDLGGFSMWELFRGEVETQMGSFTAALLAVEEQSGSVEVLTQAMRAAHSIKGAARIVQLDAGVQLAHVMEDCLVAAQKAEIVLEPRGIDVLLRAADVMLKERKKLILVPRETPLNLVHLKNMELLLLAGATLLPANPSFYTRPQTVEQVVDTVVARVLDHLLQR